MLGASYCIKSLKTFKFDKRTKCGMKVLPIFPVSVAVFQNI